MSAYSPVPLKRRKSDHLHHNQSVYLFSTALLGLGAPRARPMPLWKRQLAGYKGLKAGGGRKPQWNSGPYLPKTRGAYARKDI